MKPASGKYNLVFDNVWQKDATAFSSEVMKIWRDHGGPVGHGSEERLKQIVFLVRDQDGRIIGLSTAFKAYIKQLRNYFFAIRLMLTPEERIPGLTSKLLVSTRDFLESIHSLEDANRAIGVITLVENQRIKEHRNEAIWPASGMVYIGNSEDGHHIRVYYFKGARITP